MTTLRPYAYDHDGVTLTGLLATPAGPGPHPGVLVMHSALGLGSLVRKRAQDLADAGYVALATDMYGFEPEEQAARAGFYALTADPQLFRARVVAGFHGICALPQVESSRVSAIGFCFGGQCVLELARSGVDVASVVSFHGGLVTALSAERGAVKAKILSISGVHDPYVPLADVETFRQEMTNAGADWQMTLYGDGWHSFTDPEIGARTDIPGLRYDPLLDRLSWAQATAFMEATLEPRG